VYTLLIKKRRVKKKWSQKRLAQESGLSQAEISDIESLEKSPTIDTMIKIGMALGLCPHDLVKFNYPHVCTWNCNCDK
jgi:transcriptional regulator with XRE-family HTH domain